MHILPQMNSMLDFICIGAVELRGMRMSIVVYFSDITSVLLEQS